MRRALTLAALLSAAGPALAGGVASPAPRLQRVRVQAGDSLRSLARTYLKDPTSIAQVRPHNPPLPKDPEAALPAGELLVPVELIREEMRAAHLAWVRGRVLARLAGSAAWIRVREGEQLFSGDSLRTLAGGRARIEFDDGSALDVRPGSMVLLQREPAEAAGKGKRKKDARSLGDLSARASILAAPKAEVEGQTTAAFRVQASLDPGFGGRPREWIQEIDERPNLARHLGPGRWWIRRAALDLLGEQGRFSQPELREVSSPSR